MRYSKLISCRQLTKFYRQEFPAVSLLMRRPLSTETSADGANVVEETDDNLSEKSFAKPKRVVVCPEDARLMKISIIGLPNAGKSSLINALTNYEVCPVSKRPHTTRRNQKAVHLDEKTQLVFVDTPGLVSIADIKKFSFTDEFIYGPEKSIESSHLIAVMHDVSNNITRDKLDFRIKGVLEKFPNKRSVLILNKIDNLKKKHSLLDATRYLTCGRVAGNLLPFTSFEDGKKKSHQKLDGESILRRAKVKSATRENNHMNLPGNTLSDALRKCFTEDEIQAGIPQLGWPNFDDIFMVSALLGDGIDLLRKYMIINAELGPWIYNEDTLTDVPPQKLVIQIVKAKLLEYLPQEIPFKLKPSIAKWDEVDSGLLYVVVNITCPKEKFKWRLIGTNGLLINKISDDIERTITSLLHRRIKLRLDPVVVETK